MRRHVHMLCVCETIRKRFCHGYLGEIALDAVAELPFTTAGAKGHGNVSKRYAA